MKLLLAILLTGMGLTARAQMNYANTNGDIAVTLPNVLHNANGSVTYGPTFPMLNAVGWYSVASVQSPTNGWAVDSYDIVPGTNGTCGLTIKTQHNIQAAADAGMTNSPAWTSAFVANCKTFRTVLRAFGTTETNAVVNGETMATWIGAYAKTNTITPQLVSQLMFMSGMYPQLLNYSDTTAHFPWRLIP